MSQIVSVVYQAANFDWKQITEGAKGENSKGTFSLESLTNLDNMKLDRDYGICPILLYEFGEDDWEIFSSGKDIDTIRHRLKGLGVYHYFFPSPDQLALGVVDRGLTEIAEIKDSVSRAPKIGHPLSQSELLGENVTLNDLVDGLMDKGLVVEGEVGIEMAEAGSTARATGRFRPREGVVTRIFKNVNINMNFWSR